MQTLVGISIVVLTAIPLMWSWWFYRGQLRKCAKYPFYALRDEVIGAIASSDNPSEFTTAYENVNLTIKFLHKVRFPFWSFYSFVVCTVANVITDVLERGPEAMKSSRFAADVEQFRALSALDQKLIVLTVKAAKQNSLMFRFLGSRIGAWVVLASAWNWAVIRRFLAPRGKLHAIKTYSRLARTLEISGELKAA